MHLSASSHLLTIDCGNSTISCRRHGDGAGCTLPSSGVDLGPLTQFALELPVRRAVAVSVVPPALAAVRAALAAAGVPLAVVGEDLPCPMPIAYATRETLGADRWLGAFAAFHRFGAAVTVDCGTATTVNLVDAGGVFRGGAIAPGLAAFVAGLRHCAPALPTPDLDASPMLPAPSSQQSVDTGVLLGYAGLVERLVAEAAGVLGGAARIVVTGGNAARLLRLARFEAEHAPDLLHDGMRMLAGSGRCGS